MKVIEVESCRECPYRKEFDGHNGDDSICKRAILMTTVMFHAHNRTIPSWCPLKDKEATSNDHE